MAVQVGNSDQIDDTSRPHLYVIDFSHRAATARPVFPVHPHLVSLRRRRQLRRLRRTLEAATWVAGCGALVLLLLGGVAGLR